MEYAFSKMLILNFGFLQLSSKSSSDSRLSLAVDPYFHIRKTKSNITTMNDVATNPSDPSRKPKDKSSCRANSESLPSRCGQTAHCLIWHPPKP
jgi:hypothetical protein